MTQTSRLMLNTVVSYSRSLLALFLGLFSTRWVLQALGQEDYGLYGVVGSLLVAISFLNVTLSTSISRFYAFSIGAANNTKRKEDERDLRGWFNAALVIHCGLAILMLVIGLPLGEYAIRNVLSIPLNRMMACVWVFRISVVSSFVGLVFVPYCAFYTAYQYIAELTLFEMARTVCNFVCAYLLLNTTSDRLVSYSVMMASISIMVTIAQLWRARYQFPVRMSLLDFKFEIIRIREILRYGSLRLLGVLGWLFKAHGSAFVINLNFSPRENATYTIANQVVAHASALSASLVNAIIPALTTFAGAGEMERMRLYAIRTCKISSVLVALFAIPLICEMDYVLGVWLKSPPPYASEICSLFLVAFIIDATSVGCMTAISTETRIGSWQSVESLVLAVSVPALWLCYKSDFAFPAIGYVFMIISILTVCERLYFGWRIVGVSPMKWTREVIVPISVIIACGVLCGKIISGMMPMSICRLTSVVITTCISTTSLFIIFAMDSVERQYLVRLMSKARVQS